MKELDINDTDISSVIKYKNIKTKSKMIIYFDGIYWKSMRLWDALKYGIIYDTYTDKEEKTIPITIIVCPKTLITCIFRGKFKYKQYINDIMQIETNDGVILNINDNRKKNEMSYHLHKSGLDIKIDVLRNVLVYHPDCKYINLKQNIKTSITREYYLRQVVYVINYINDNNVNKTTIIIGKDDSDLGYDLKKSEIIKYLHEEQQMLLELNAFIFSMLLDLANIIYPDAKIIKL